MVVGVLAVQGAVREHLDALRRVGTDARTVSTPEELANKIEAAAQDQPSLDLMDITVERNAFGRQVDSFEADLDFAGVNGGPIRAVFIRAPIITAVGTDAQTLATHEGRVVAVQQDRMLALSFHPELTADSRIHQYFLSLR